MTVENVAGYRHRKDVVVEVPGFGVVTGDVAWGGNWFFLTEGAPVALTLANRDALTEYTWAIRQALGAQGITGAEGQEVDHVEVFAESRAGEPKFCVVSGEGVRPLALRDGNEREACLSGGGWKAGAGRGVAAGRDSGDGV